MLPSPEAQTPRQLHIQEVAISPEKIAKELVSYQNDIFGITHKKTDERARHDLVIAAATPKSEERVEAALHHSFELLSFQGHEPTVLMRIMNNQLVTVHKEGLRFFSYAFDGKVQPLLPEFIDSLDPRKSESYERHERTSFILPIPTGTVLLLMSTGFRSLASEEVKDSIKTRGTLEESALRLSQKYPASIFGLISFKTAP